MYFCDMKEVTLSPQGENSRFLKIITLLKLLLWEMNKNPSYQLTKVIFTLLENISA